MRGSGYDLSLASLSGGAQTSHGVGKKLRKIKIYQLVRRVEIFSLFSCAQSVAVLTLPLF